MIRYITLVSTLILFSTASFADQKQCEKISVQAEKEQSYVRPVLGLRVTGSDRLYFHSAPDTVCSTQTFVIPKDQLIAYTEWRGWYSVQYTNLKTGGIYDGWIPTHRVQVTGTMGMDSSSSTAKSPPEKSPSSLPPDVTPVVKRLESCFHFSGEINGDRSERDKEVSAILKELSCDTIDRDVEAIRKKYPTNKVVLDAIKQATEL